MAGVADPRGAVHGETDVLVAGQGRLAGVDADPDAQLDSLGPPLRGECALRRHGGLDRLLRPVEGDEERVAVGVEFSSTRLRPGRAQQLLVLPHDLPVAVPKPAQERSGALDVGEEEGDGRGGGLVHRHATGSLARSRKPPSGRGPASSSPP